jgi:hypothetical protein
MSRETDTVSETFSFRILAVGQSPETQYSYLSDLYILNYL